MDLRIDYLWWTKCSDTKQSFRRNLWWLLPLFNVRNRLFFSAEEDTIKHQLGFDQFSFPSSCLKRMKKESRHNSKNRPSHRVVCSETNIWSRRFALSPLALLHVHLQFILFFERLRAEEQLVIWFSKTSVQGMWMHGGSRRCIFMQQWSGTSSGRI